MRQERCSIWQLCPLPPSLLSVLLLPRRKPDGHPFPSRPGARVATTTISWHRHSLGVSLMGTPSLGLSMSSGTTLIRSLGTEEDSAKFLSTAETTTLSSIWANFCPMQFLGPAEKGT